MKNFAYNLEPWDGKKTRVLMLLKRTYSLNVCFVDRSCSSRWNSRNILWLVILFKLNYLLLILSRLCLIIINDIFSATTPTSKMCNLQFGAVDYFTWSQHKTNNEIENGYTAFSYWYVYSQSLCFVKHAHIRSISLRKRCPYSEFFSSGFSRIWSEHENLIVQSECAKIWSRKTPNTDIVYVVSLVSIFPLNSFSLMFHFYTFWKCQKTKRFFQGVSKWITGLKLDQKKKPVIYGNTGASIAIHAFRK